MSDETIALSIDQLVVKRGNSTIGPISLDLLAGNQMVLSGSNGAGKSSVLLAVAGLIPVHSGSVEIGSVKMTGHKQAPEPWQRSTGWLGQERGLWPHLTVKAQCQLVARAHGGNLQRIDQHAELLGIADRIDRHPGQLSGGEAQRSELLRTVSAAASLFLLDEPFSAQNQQGRERIEELLANLCHEGAAILLALHQGGPEDDVISLDVT